MSTESRNSTADVATSSKTSNDNRGESEFLKSSSRPQTPSIDAIYNFEDETNSKEGESASSLETRKRKSFANSDDLSESSLIIDVDWDVENDDASTNPVFESPKQNEVPQGRPADDSPSPPPSKMPRVAAKFPKAQPSSEQGGSKNVNAHSSKKSNVNKRTGSVSNAVGRPKNAPSDRVNQSPKASSVNGVKTVSNATKNITVPSVNKTNSLYPKHSSTTPAKGGSSSSKSIPNGTIVPTTLSNKNNPTSKSNLNCTASPNQKRNSADGSCNSSDQENNGSEAGDKTDVPATAPGRQGLLQPQNNNLLAAVRQNAVLDQVMITDVTSNLVTVTVLECWTSAGFFRDRGDAVSEPNSRS